MQKSDSAPPAEPMPFPRVDLRIWRTGVALFVATFDDAVSQRFLGDIQRAVDRLVDQADLTPLPHFQWPPPEQPELANLRSVRSAWRALLQRQHRARPLRLLVLFGDATPLVAAMADPLSDAGQSVATQAMDAPATLSAPALRALQSSPSEKRALWMSLLDAT